jgi:hypothetical protein
MLLLLLFLVAVASGASVISPAFGSASVTMTGDQLWACLVARAGATVGATSLTAAQLDTAIAAANAAECRVVPDTVTGASIVSACDINNDGNLGRDDLLNPLNTFCNNTGMAKQVQGFCNCMSS